MLIAIWVSIDLSILLAYSLLSRGLSGNPRAQQMLHILPNMCLLGLGLTSTRLTNIKIF